MHVTQEKQRIGKSKGWIDQQSVLWYRVLYTLLSLYFRLWGRGIHVFGGDNVPRFGGSFVVANHSSYLDPLILGRSVEHRIFRGPGKAELFQNRPLAFAMRKIGIFPLRQGVADPGGIRTMVELYRKGACVIVFPEGGRTRDGQLQPFFPDFARLMIKLKAPLIPAAIAGAAEMLPVGRAVPRRGVPIVVVYGERFDLSEFYGRKLTPELAEDAAGMVRDHVAALLEEARARAEALTPSRRST